jgi:hypothetical protein
MFYSFHHFLHQHQSSNTTSNTSPSNMRPDSNDIAQGWLAIPFNGGVNLNTTDEQSSPPAYTHKAANHFAPLNYDAGTSPVATAAASRRSDGSSSSSSLSGYALPSSLPSYIEMQNLSGQTGGSSTPSASEASATAQGSLPAPVTQPKEHHSRAYRFSEMVLVIVVKGILIVGLCAVAICALWFIYQFIFWILYKVTGQRKEFQS